MTKKKELRLLVRYEPPQASLIRLREPLSLMASFSRGGGGFEDWDIDDSFAELDEEYRPSGLKLKESLLALF